MTAEFDTDCEEFGKAIAKLIRVFVDDNTRAVYRQGRKDHMIKMNKLLGTDRTYKEHLA